MNTWRWRLLKWACLMVSLLSVCVAAWLMWHGKESIAVTEPVANQTVAPTQVEKPLMVERKGERIVWRLKADAAKQQEQVMLLTQPVLELFTETDEVIEVRGEKAWFEPLKRNIHFKGDVKVKYRDWLLVSSQLRFDSARDEVLVEGSFTATANHTTVKGRSLRADRKTQHIHVAHDVWVKDTQTDRLGGLQ
ncbi:MAG: LPS export ABC transporter periplasmic protein LptC [Mariprofundaceae bacterium]